MYPNFTKFAMLAIIIFLFFAWIGKPTNTPTSSEVAETTQPETKIEGDEFKDAFMKECNVSNKFKEYCECGYRFVQNTETLESLKRMIESSDKTEINKMTDSAYAACKDQI